MNISNITYGKKYAAIEYAENTTFNYLQLTKKKDEFNVFKEGQFRSLEQVKEELKTQKHLFLVVNNEHVLSKIITLSQADSKSILRTAFPNITITDFYYDIHTTENHSYVSIVRKEVVDEIISEFAKEGISIIDFSLGNLVIQNLKPFIENGELCSSNAVIEIQNKEVIAIKKGGTSSQEYTINNLKISSHQLLTLSGVIGYYSKIISSNIQKQLRDNYLQKRFFDVGLKTSLGFLLIILLINFLFFSHYREKVGNLSGELQLSETFKKQLNILQGQVTQKKQLVSSVNSASNSKLSKYIDELGISVPKTVLLSQINYQPLKGTIRADKQLAFESQKIIVKGTSKENDNFSKWISDLEKKDWIDKIEIIAYGKGKKGSTISNFEFLITINDR